MKRAGRVMIVFAVIFLAGIAAVRGIYVLTDKTAEKYIADSYDLEADCIIVPGAGVVGDRVSLTLARRLDKAIEIYNKSGIDRIIVSGDHGRKEYDEVNVMRSYLSERGIPIENIFMDHAGFSTYDTLYRARDVFMVKKAVIVTQRLHLMRALYIADRIGLEAQGIIADEGSTASRTVQEIREYPARVKAFLQCNILHSKPKYLGDPIPVSGNGLVTEG